MKCINLSEINRKKNKTKSNCISPYLVQGKINKKIKYDKKYSLNNFISIKDNNNEIRIIGSGSFGKVYLSKNIIDNKIYAIKHMDKNKLIKLLHSLKGIHQEIDIQSRIEHENIIKILYAHEDKENFYLVMDYAKNGNLFHYVRKNNGLDELQTFQLFIQVVNAVNFLHKNDLIHRDIKPENILLFNNEKDNNKFIVKLCDFGWCVKLDGVSRKTFCGTTEYMSPELIEHRGYNKEIDVWSLGILLYEMIHGYSPFKPNKAKFNEKDVFENIKKHNLKFNKKVSERCKNLIYNLLAFNKNKRYKVEDIYNSEFVQFYANNKITIPSINKIQFEIINKRIINSLSKVNDRNHNRNISNEIKKFSNSFVNKIPNHIYSMINTKRNSKTLKYDESKLISNKSLDKKNIISFIKARNKDNINQRNKYKKNHINKTNSNSKFNLTSEILYMTNKFISKNISSFDFSKRQKSVTNSNTSRNKNYCHNIENRKKKEQINKAKLNKKNIVKENSEDDTIKLDSFSENFIKYVIRDFRLNTTNYINRKSPEKRNLLFKYNNLSLKLSKNNKERNKNEKIKESKIININDQKLKNKKRNIIKYKTDRNSKLKSNSFSSKKSNLKKIQKNNINHKQYSPKSDYMFMNRINNVNYQNNNINNFYIINNTNINNIKNDYLNDKEFLFEHYLKNVKIKENNKNKKNNLDSSQDTEKSLTPKKNKDNVKIEPIKLLGNFKIEYKSFYNFNNDKKKSDYIKQ